MAPAPLLAVDARMLRSTGIGTYLTALVPRLLGHLPELSVRLLTAPAAPPDEALARHPRVSLRAVRSGVYAPGEQLEIPLAARGADALWVPHVNVPWGWPGRLLASVHDTFYLSELPRQLGVRVDKQLYLRACHLRLERRGTTVICPSRFTVDELLRHQPRLSARIHLIPHGVDARWLALPPSPRPHPRPYLLHTGNLKPHKNLPRLLAAFAAVAPRLPHDLALVGPGDPAPLLAGLAPEVRARVVTPGVVPEAELEAWVAHAAALVMVSLYEGFGLPPLEALAAGVPVVVARSASLPEVCGEAAVYCAPDSVESMSEALLGVTTLPVEERARLAALGRAQARALSWDRSGESTARVLRDVLRLG